MKKIYTNPGPEDMALDASTGTPRLLIACTQRRKGQPAYGGIDVYEFSGDRALPMQLDWNGAPLPFFPHGISVVKASTGHYLYAINHVKEGEANDQVKHSVIRFKILGNVLQLDNVYAHELLRSPNDIFAMPDGSFYFTNDNTGTSRWEIFHALLLKGKRGSIGHCDAQGKWRLLVEDLKMPNGIAIRDNVLYTTLARAGQLIRYDLTAPGQVDILSEKAVAQIKGGDNLTFEGSKYLLTTSHPNGLRFVRHWNDAARKSPTVVYRVDTANPDPETNAEIIFENDGSLISAGSTALRYGDKLYISQVFEGYLMETDYPMAHSV